MMNNEQETSSTSTHGHGAEQEKDVKSTSYGDDSRKVTKVRVNDEDMNSEISTLKSEKPRTSKEKDELESAKAKMGEVKEENKRLKKMLQQIENDYRCLQTRFSDILQHPSASSNPALMKPSNEAQKGEERSEADQEEPEISLSFGLIQAHETNTSRSGKAREDVGSMSEGLSLGLEFKPGSSRVELSSERSNEEEKEDETAETWPPSKVLKTMRNGGKEEESSEQEHRAKRARVCVRARCDSPTMNDGCQWRKYGQKIAKGNPCPRAYYRCTVAPSCPVRKQVQRSSEDMSILLTTYEGTHNHPLSSVATAMASTTSAAASILLSGSSTTEGLTSPTSTTTTTTTTLNGLNFTLYNNSRPPDHFNLPSSSSLTPPTITLDLTTTTPSSHFPRRISPNSFLSSPRHSSQSLDFSTSRPNTVIPMAWPNPYFNDYTSSLPSNKSPIGTPSSGKMGHQQMSQLYPKRINQVATPSSQQLLTETLTKVLTSDPSFQSAVAAAISSMVGSSNSSVGNTNRVSSLDGLAPKLRWDNQVLGASINVFSQNDSNTCGPTFLSKPAAMSSNSQATGSFMSSQPSLPFSLSKSSTSPDLEDQLK